MAATACPECNETRRTTLTVSPTSERFPLPVFRWTCKRCGHIWIVDENKTGDDGATGTSAAAH